MPVGSTGLAKLGLLPFAVIFFAAFELDLSHESYVTDVVAVLFALSGGMATQLGLLAESRRRWTLIFSELSFSALGGFLIHAILITRVEEHRIIWGTCAAVGATGSSFLRQYGHRYLKHVKMFQQDESDEGDKK